MSGDPARTPGALPPPDAPLHGFEPLFALSLDLVQVLTFDGVVLRINEGWVDTMGYDRTAVVGRNTAEFLHPDDVGRTMKFRERLRLGQEVPRFENRYRRHDGTYAWIQWNAVSFPQHSLLMAVGRDVTRQKEAERELRINERRFRMLAENARDVIFRYRVVPKPACEFISPSVLSVTGYAQREFYSDPHLFRAVVFADDQSLLDEATDPGKVASDSAVVRCLRKDGRLIWLEQRGVRIKDSDGQLVAIEGVVRDVTEREEAMRALQRSREDVLMAQHETEDILTSMTAVLVSCDAALAITRWNGEAERVFGLSSATVRGKPIDTCGASWPAAIMRATTERALIDGHARIDDLDFKHVTGAPGTLSLVMTRTINVKGETTGVMVVGIDVTARRQLERQLAQAQKLESIGFLAAGVAHEINTPIQYVGDNVRFLEGGTADVARVVEQQRVALEAIAATDGEAADIARRTLADTSAVDMAFYSAEMPVAIQEALDGIERVATIVRAMKDFSHPGYRERKLVDVNDVLAKAIVLSRNEWKYKADVDASYAPDLPHVLGVAGDLSQVFLNLVVNAAQAIDEKPLASDNAKGRIDVRTTHDDRWVTITIRDTGVGIPRDKYQTIFEPFYTTKEVGKGTGQGLAIVRAAVVDRHNGEVAVESELGVGTTFQVRLPVARGATPLAFSEGQPPSAA